jgi:SET domain-containing protein
LQTPEDLAWKQSREDRGQTITGTYLYGVVIPNGEAIYVDAEDEYQSLWTRFINHASPPDANVNPKSIHESFDGKPRVWFVANRDIEAGEEICFDYGDDYWLPEDNVV